MTERLYFDLDDEHAAMLDAIRDASGRHATRSQIAKSMLVAVLQDDAAAHGLVPDRDRCVVRLCDWRRKGDV